jgi:hypothetical protein
MPMPLLRLASVLAKGPTHLDATPLRELIGSLPSGAGIEFQHMLRNEQGRCIDYALRVACDVSPVVSPDVVAESIRLACRSFAWEPDRQTSARPLPFQYDFSPCGLEAYAAPIRRRAGSPHALLPAPIALPSWSLTRGIAGDMELPRHVRVAVRFEPWRLESDAQARAWTLMHRLRDRSLLAVAAAHEPSPYASDTRTSSQVDELVSEWLAAPDGFALRLRIEASAELSPATASMLARDVFGHVPIAPSLHETARGGWHQAFSFAQGWPGFLPAEALVTELGIPRHFESRVRLPARTGLRIGTLAGTPGQRLPVHLPSSTRDRHVAIVGASGTGKSNLMLHMIQQDIKDSARPGVVLIDLHGDLYRDVLRSLPADRVGDAILVDVTDPDFSGSINPFALCCNHPGLSQQIVSQLSELIEMLVESDESRGPAATSHVKALMQLAVAQPDRSGSFLDALCLLTLGQEGGEMLDKLQENNAEAVRHWRDFLRTSGDNGYYNWVPYLRARLSPFTDGPAMRRLLCRPGASFDMRNALDEGKIMIFNLSKSVLQDTEAAIAGSVLLSQLMTCVLARTSQAQAERRKTHLYVDEFQALATPTIARMLAEVRKFGVSITLACQHLGQMSRRGWDVRGAVLANTAGKIMFRLSPGDARYLDDYYEPSLTQAEVVTMPDFHAACAFAGSEATQARAFVVKMESAHKWRGADSSNSHVEWSRAHHAIPNELADAELAAFAALGKTSGGYAS